jgi:hypothetical protein
MSAPPDLLEIIRVHLSRRLCHYFPTKPASNLVVQGYILDLAVSWLSGGHWATTRDLFAKVARYSFLTSAAPPADEQARRLNHGRSVLTVS